MFRKGQASSKQRLSSGLFSDPTQFWNKRFHKKIPRSPEFRNKRTSEPFWIDGWSIPRVEGALVSALIQGRAQSSDGLNKNSSGSCGDVRTLKKAGQRKDFPHTLNRHGSGADSSTYVCLLRECIKLGNLEMGKQVHAHIVQTGFKPNIFLLSTLVNMYAKCGSVAAARTLFDRMHDRDVFAWSIMVAGYAQHGHGREAFEVYQQMIREGVTPNNVTFICILKACASLGALGKGKEVHAHIVKAGIAPDIILETALAAMYAKCGNMKEARQVFDNMAQRNVVSWSAMISGYAQHGCGMEAFEMYEQMILEGVTPNKVTFICILNACASLEALEKGKAVHVHIIKSGIASDIILETALAAMYAKCGNMREARRVFNNMAERNVVSWNVMISGYAQHRCGLEALKVYKEMIGEGMKPNKVTFICVLNACVSLEGLEKGKEVHADIAKAGIPADIVLDTALVDMYAKCGSMKDARQVFNNMTERNVVTWSAIIAGYAQHGCGREAFEMYEQMIGEGVVPNNITFAAILKACVSLGTLSKGKEVHANIIKAGIAPDIILQNTLVNMYAKCGSIKDANKVFNSMAEQDVVSWNAMITGYAQHGYQREALQLFEQMQREGLKPDVVSWSSMIAGYAQHGCARKAFEMYKQMVREGCTPNCITFICVLNACASLAALEKGKQVHADIIEAGIAPNIILENTLVNMYAKCGSVNSARRVFDNMTEQDVISWNAMIAGYGQHGYGREALELFAEMQKEGLKPDCITLTCILSACSHVGLVDEGLHYFNSMRLDHGLTPTGEHFGCMVDLLGRAGRLDEAEEFIYKMPIDPDAPVWGALLGACGNHGNLEVAERVAQCLLKQHPQHIATYVLLSNIYAAAGRWDDTAKVRKIMEDRCQKVVNQNLHP